MRFSLGVSTILATCVYFIPQRMF